MTRPSFDEYFLEVAKTIAIRSDCERSQVGAVLVDASNRVRSTGYNGAAPGQPGCLSCPRRLSNVEPGTNYRAGPGRCIAFHAEINAINYCDPDEDLSTCSLYITRAPCHDCFAEIVLKGIHRVVWPTDEWRREH